VISHNSALLESVVNKVFHLDAERTTVDIYNIGWKAYLDQRETDARRRHREAAGARRQAAVLQAQADRMRAKATKAKAAQGLEPPDTGEVRPGHGLRIGYYAQEHETLDLDRTVLANMASAAPELSEPEQRRVLGSFLFPGDDVTKPAGVLSGGERTRLALAL